MQKLNFLLIFSLFATLVFGQNNDLVVTGTVVQPEVTKGLEEQFKQYEVFDLNATQLKQQLEQQSEVLFSLRLGDKVWDLHLLRNRKVSRNRTFTVLDENGKRSFPARNSPQVWQGYLRRDPSSRVSLTINDGFLYGMVIEGENTYFIEPASSFIPVQDKQRFVVYEGNDVREEMKDFCGVGELEKAKGKYLPDHDHDHDQDRSATSRSMMGCVEVELAIAADWLMFQKYGTTNAVENHIEGVLNNVQTNYDTEFNDEISFVTVEYFFSTCSSCDPWTSSTSASAVLNSFTNWGNSGGFSGPYDLASFWTDRNFNGGTIGIAWLSGVCFSTRYHAIQDFSTNANLMRVLVSHEIGHNFSARHDPSGSGTIMAPAVNNTNTWSNQSLNQINGFYPGLFCLGSCTVDIPPVADFSADVIEGCAPLTVNFTDESRNNPTSWDWSFPGGTPAFSFDQNPTVVYDQPGFYDVTLTVTNSAGSDTETRNGYITVNGPPVPDFLTTELQDTVFFANISQDGDSFFWTFGDGEFSTEENPTHIYPFDGDYDVTLSVTNECGTESITQTITIVTRPVADFDSSNPIGCDSLTVTYTNRSTPNITSLQWEFPGGIPSTSTQANPTVRYLTPGIYDVRLTVSNSRYSDVDERIDYIDLGAPPTAGFGYLKNDLTVEFTDTSSGAQFYDWDFGDGNSSTEQNPVHTYTAGGNYTVTLVTSNECGTDTAQTVISVLGVPLADFTSDVDTGCAPFQVNYTDLSSPNITSRQWSFPGGIPASSTEANPVVVYEQSGNYDVTLIVNNTLGSDTLTITEYIESDSIPIANFGAFPTDLTVQFRDSSVHADTLCWDFGDGDTTMFIINPRHTYDADGTYAVTLISKNECGRDTMVKNVTVATLPTADFTVDQDSGCVPFTANFSSLASSNTTSWSWTFPGASPDTSSAENPTVVYNTTGSYDVTLIVSTAAGSDTLSRTAYINVNDVPVPGFSFSVNGTTASFSNTSSNADSYNWDFGDGNSSTETSPTHDYGTDGVYTVTLSATNDCGTTTAVQTVTIVTLPTGTFSASPTSGCAPLAVTFTGPTGNISSYSWSFPGGTPATSTEQNPIVTYAAAGSYDVSLTISNAAGSTTISEQNYINVDDVPDAEFTYTINGTSVSFTNTSTNANNYSWDFGDGNSSTETSPTHDYGTDGVYTVVLSATNDCGTTTATQTVTIVTQPTGSFSASPTSGCAPLAVNFTGPTGNITSYSWEFQGGAPATSTEQNPVVTYAAAGTYDVSLTITNAAGSTTITESNYITVTDVPQAGFTYIVNGTTVNFTNTSSNANSYSWDFGDGNSSTDSSPSHDYATDGVYTVTLSATNDCGTVTSQQIITIVTPPTADFTTSATDGCTPFTVNFTDASTSNTTTWRWRFPGGTPSASTEQNPVVVYTDAGVYDVELIASNAAGQDVLLRTDWITVNAGPTADFVANVNGLLVTFTNQSNNATTYNWDFGDGNFSTETSPTHTYATDGVYTVTLSATNECGTVTSQQTITVVTSPVAGFTADVTSGCEPLTVNFTDASSSNTTSWSWRFPGGTPAFSSDPNPVVVYNTPGTYNVELTVRNSSGQNTLIESDYVTVNTTPDADFTLVATFDTVSFTNNSSNAASYSWDFGDGNFSTETSPTHIYAADGTYTIQLSATNECGTVTSERTITIVTPPVANFTADQTSGCAPMVVQFTDASSSNTTQWSWTFPGGSPSRSSDPNPVVTYDDAGTYDVELVVRNSAGESTVIRTSLIVVNDVPTAAFNSTINGTVVQFTNNSDNATSYLWDFGDGATSTAENPSHDFLTDGEYTVTLNVTNECGTVSTQQVVTIVTLPSADFTPQQATGCAPLSVDFTDGSSANATGWRWSFPGGSPSSSTRQNPSVTYFDAGSYDVQLIVSNSAGQDTIIKTGIIVVNDRPTADFTSSINGAEVTFTNNSDNATSYSWNFGDGNTSTAANPIHQYAADGNYTVTLTATNECGSVTTTNRITIVTAPIAGFTTSQTSGCTPFTVRFTDNSSDNTTQWFWSFPGGSPATSTSANPAVTYNTPGTYSVTMVVSNSTGADTLVQTDIIVVNGLPSATFTSAVMDNQVTFTNLSTNATTYLWDFGDGTTSTETSPVHVYASDGTYRVSLTATNECGNASFVQTITVEIVTIPLAGFTADVTSGCAPLEVSFTDQSSDNTTSWEWQFEGGDPAVSTEQHPVVTYTEAGEYTVTLIVRNGAGSNSSSQVAYITVEEAPVAAFTTQQNNLEVNFLNSSSANASTATFNWDFGDGTSSVVENPSHVYDQEGTYTVQLIVANNCGADTITTDIVVENNVAPTAAIGFDALSGCVPLTINFRDLSSGSPTAWEWIAEEGDPMLSTEQNPSITFIQTGTFTVQLIVTNAFGMDTTAVTVTVIDLPEAGFTSSANGAEVSFANTSNRAASYLWDFGDGTTSTQESPTHTYSASGTYLVELIVSNTCGEDTVRSEVVVTLTSTLDPEWVDDLRLFPNPNDGHFQLFLQTRSTRDVQIRLHNVVGQLVFDEQKNLSGGILSRSFDFSHLPKGTYLFQLIAGDRIALRKVVIQ